MKAKINRDSNIELLRIVLMFMIVVMHVIVHGGILSNVKPTAFDGPRFIMGHFIVSFFVMAVDCFVLISGFYGIRISIEKILRLYLPILFYSIVLFISASFVYNKKLIISDASYLLPFLSNKYWFVTYYLLLTLFSPLLNKILMNITKHQLQHIIIIGLFLFVIVPSLTPFSLTGDRGFGIINFILLYFIGNYLKKYYQFKIFNYVDGGGGGYLLIYLLSSACMFAMSLFFKKYFNYDCGYDNRFYAYDSIFCYCSAIAMFLFFKSINIKLKLINWMAGYMFCIYLIHEHPLIRKYIFNGVLRNRIFIPNEYLVLRFILSCVIIFTSCLVIEIIRSLLMRNIESYLIFKVTNFVESKPSWTKK
jgi:surface polysaccharide O-acyltransferase-like enzyme